MGRGHDNSTHILCTTILVQEDARVLLEVSEELDIHGLKATLS